MTVDPLPTAHSSGEMWANIGHPVSPDKLALAVGAPGNTFNMHRLLLGADGPFVCGWRNESVLDRRACILVLLEKVIPSGRIIARAAGVIFMAGGGWMLIQHA